MLYADPIDEATLDRALAALAHLPEIRRVELSGPAIDDEKLAALKVLPRLVELDLSRTRVTSAGLERLAQHVSLKFLKIDGYHGSADLLGIAAHAKLQGLWITDHAISRNEMDAIASLPELESLTLEKLRPLQGARTYEPLADAPRLKSLYELRSGIDDGAVPTLAKLERLETLSLECDSNQGITDAGLDQLITLPNLRTAAFYGRISIEGVQSFSAACPKCVVGYRPIDTYGAWYRAGKRGSPSRPSKRGLMPDNAFPRGKSRETRAKSSRSRRSGAKASWERP
jgi:hypothetical protein